MNRIVPWLVDDADGHRPPLGDHQRAILPQPRTCSRDGTTHWSLREADEFCTDRLRRAPVIRRLPGMQERLYPPAQGFKFILRRSAK